MPNESEKNIQNQKDKEVNPVHKNPQQNVRPDPSQDALATDDLPEKGNRKEEMYQAPKRNESDIERPTNG